MKDIAENDVPPGLRDSTEYHKARDLLADKIFLLAKLKEIDRGLRHAGAPRRVAAGGARLQLVTAVSAGETWTSLQADRKILQAHIREVDKALRELEKLGNRVVNVARADLARRKVASAGPRTRRFLAGDIEAVKVQDPEQSRQLA
ncbi:hypothetical protein BH11PSE11_BH11PSE11_21460 [soil metagenome]